MVWKGVHMNTVATVHKGMPALLGWGSTSPPTGCYLHCFWPSSFQRMWKRWVSLYPNLWFFGFIFIQWGGTNKCEWSYWELWAWERYWHGSLSDRETDWFPGVHIVHHQHCRREREMDGCSVLPPVESSPDWRGCWDNCTGEGSALPRGETDECCVLLPVELSPAVELVRGQKENAQVHSLKLVVERENKYMFFSHALQFHHTVRDTFDIK